MNDRVSKKEKAKLLPYKGNIWEGKVRVSVDTRTQEPGLKGSFHVCGAQHFCGPAAGVYNTLAHSTFKSSTFIYEREEKPEDKSKESHPRRAEQLNFFSSVTGKWGVDVLPWRGDTKSQTVTALWSLER